ncbi:type II toxin-antitoxin system CcdA family antitoxin [Paracoccus sp. Z118]|uniref:type II toxin-antitoxin system CcdA family antitoxin n=1 Tax=Paracoccus sp. Z118 TaxID=2851017 RepID=UPI001C2BD853|nr:type II toxin-antitoxin system CcdA family antitoxin [Paracoccus sp. Z118]MBV0893507.1 type II toxin-antitoxin system CcdA family antitoxin [Paracoccus sp. Z118]
MVTVSRRKTSLSLDAAALDDARDLGINVSAVADTALRRAVTEARRRKWLEENAEAFAHQAEWHERNGHPLAAILASPGTAAWND